MLWVALALSFVVVVAWLATRRLRASVSVQATASEDGWALAGGASVGALAASGARTGGGGAWAVHLFGKKVIGSGGKTTRAKAAPRDRAKTAKRVLGVASEIDPIVAVELALDAVGRVRVESLALRVRGGDPDPLLMGRVAAVLAVASGLLAPVADVDAALDWAAETPSIDAAATVEVSFVPIVLAFDVARFAARQVALRARTALARRPAPALALERS